MTAYRFVNSECLFEKGNRFMLTTAHVEILQALINRILPADDDPGGWEAGVGDYLFAQFERDLKSLLPLYEVGLAALDAEAQVGYGFGFVQISPSEQDALLTRVEVGAVAAVWAVDPIVFFRRVVNHCAEGYYSDPDNGGNKAAASWTMIGFEVTG